MSIQNSINALAGTIGAGVVGKAVINKAEAKAIEAEEKAKKAEGKAIKAQAKEQAYKEENRALSAEIDDITHNIGEIAAAINPALQKDIEDIKYYEAGEERNAHVSHVKSHLNMHLAAEKERWMAQQAKAVQNATINAHTKGRIKSTRRKVGGKK